MKILIKATTNKKINLKEFLAINRINLDKEISRKRIRLDGCIINDLNLMVDLSKDHIIKMDVPFNIYHM